MRLIERVWFEDSKSLQIIKYALWPLMLLFWLLSATRRLAFKMGLKTSHKLPAIVIVVGNISVGGNGKTPLVIRLAQWLKQYGYRPGVISRGYGGQGENYPLVVEVGSDPKLVGDEPVLMRQHLGCPLIVDPNRPRGAKQLIDQFKCDVIICDDGLQHYALQRDIEIAVMDGQRRLGNGWLLPMGPLRERKWRLKAVDFVVVNGGIADKGEILMSLESGQLVNVKYPNKSKSISDLHRPVTAAAAIGNPSRFFNLLKTKQVRLKNCLTFPDHHQFKATDLPLETVLMTEKDAVKCREFAHEDWWYLPVSAKLTEDFKSLLLNRITALKRTN